MGHGPSILEKCWGPEIDKFDAVVRMKWGHRGREETPDYFGKRLDYLVSTLRTWKSYRAVKMKEYWAYENVHCGRNLYPIAKAYGDVPVIVDHEAMNYWLGEYRKFRERGEPHFSTGIAAIIMACVRLKPKLLALVGFDNTISGETENYKSVFRDDDHNYPGHQWDVEHILTPLIAAHYKTELAVLQ